MSRVAIEYGPHPKARKFEPMLPKHFQFDSSLLTSPREGDSKVISVSLPQISPRSQFLNSSRSDAGPPSPQSLLSLGQDIKSQIQNLKLEKMILLNELYRTEEHHTKKMSLHSRLSGLQMHFQTLNTLAENAREVLTKENALLTRLNHNIVRLKVSGAITLPEDCNRTTPTSALMLCTDISGVMSILEFSETVTAHLSNCNKACSVAVPSCRDATDLSLLKREIVPHLCLKSRQGAFELVFSQECPRVFITSALVLSGFPYPVASVKLSPEGQETRIQVNEEAWNLSLKIPTSKLNLCADFPKLLTSDRMKLRTLLEANLLVKKDGDEYKFTYKSLSFHLGRLFYKPPPKHGEVVNIVTTLQEISVFAHTDYERPVCEAKIYVRGVQVSVTLYLETITDALRLRLLWSHSEVTLKEEEASDTFLFLKKLQFQEAKKAPVTLLKSLELFLLVKSYVIDV